MKYLTKKVIKNSLYYYLQYGPFSRVLGHSLPDDLKAVLKDFFLMVARGKAAVTPERIKKEFPFGGAEGLEEAHYRYTCLQHDLFRKEWNDFHFWFAIYFTFNSNRAEGSKVSRPEIEAFAKTRIRKPKTKTEREIFNSFQALQFAFSPEMQWNLKSIKHVHALLLKDLSPLEAGRFKNENNVAPGNQQTTRFQEVTKALKRLLSWLQKGFQEKQYSPLLALEFYVRFERIHPFLDGNGRVGRILFNSLLHHHHYLPVIFFTGNHQEHCASIQKALEGRKLPLHRHFIKQLKKTVEIAFFKK